MKVVPMVTKPHLPFRSGGHDEAFGAGGWERLYVHASDGVTLIQGVVQLMQLYLHTPY